MWGAHSSRAAGRPFASVRARVAPRPAHGGALTAGRHAGRGGLLTSSRCRAGAASAVHQRVVCTCGATRLRIEWSEERWGVVSSVRTFRTGTCRSTVSTASAPPRPAQPPAPHRGAPRASSVFSTPPPSPPRAPPQPHRASPPPRRLLCHLSSAIAIASMIAAASFPPPPLPPPPSPPPPSRLASTTPYSLAPPQPLPPLLSPPCTRADTICLGSTSARGRDLGRAWRPALAAQCSRVGRLGLI